MGTGISRPVPLHTENSDYITDHSETAIQMAKEQIGSIRGASADDSDEEGHDQVISVQQQGIRVGKGTNLMNGAEMQHMPLGGIGTQVSLGDAASDN